MPASLPAHRLFAAFCLAIGTALSVWILMSWLPVAWKSFDRDASLSSVILIIPLLIISPVLFALIYYGCRLWKQVTLENIRGCSAPLFFIVSFFAIGMHSASFSDESSDAGIVLVAAAAVGITGHFSTTRFFTRKYAIPMPPLLQIIGRPGLMAITLALWFGGNYLNSRFSDANSSSSLGFLVSGALAFAFFIGTTKRLGRMEMEEAKKARKSITS